jgi:hypothetical protein
MLLKGTFYVVESDCCGMWPQCVCVRWLVAKISVRDEVNTRKGVIIINSACDCGSECFRKK